MAFLGVVLAGAGLAGCRGDPAVSPSPSSSASPVSSPLRPEVGATAADSANTRAVCIELGNLNAAGRQSFEVQWTKLRSAVAAGDEAAGAHVGDGARQELLSWAEAVETLSGRARSPVLRASIVEMAGTLAALASDTDGTPIDQVQPKLDGLTRRYAEVCP